MAANSPYTRPGSGGNEQRHTPGDGSTECGAGCTCRLSYEPPHLVQWPPLTTLSAYQRAIRRVPYDKREAVYEEYRDKGHSTS